eukprot:COSAG01_NODE_5161_length_4439_cov_6.008291_4_plen_148_part_00
MEKAFCASGAGAGAVAVPEGMGAAPGGGGPISCASLTGPLGGKPAANRSRYLHTQPAGGISLSGVARQAQGHYKSSDTQPEQRHARHLLDLCSAQIQLGAARLHLNVRTRPQLLLVRRARAQTLCRAKPPLGSPRLLYSVPLLSSAK